MKKLQYLLYSVFISLTSCIGTDIIEDGEPFVEPEPESQESLQISPEEGALMVGDNLSFSTTYTNFDGDIEDVSVTFSSSDESIITVDQDGLATAVVKGMASVIATYETFTSSAQVVVVDDTVSVARVELTTPVSELAIGSNTQLTTKVLNVNGNPLSGKTVTYTLSNNSVASITADGLLTINTFGEFEVTATSDDIPSLPLSFSIPDPNANKPRTGIFEGVGGYSLTGNATLGEDGEGDLILTFSDDFSVSSGGRGLVIYLSNDENDAPFSGRIDNIKGLSGGQSYNITALIKENNEDPDAQPRPQIGLEDYSHVVVWCEPFGISFGFAELND